MFSATAPQRAVAFLVGVAAQHIFFPRTTMRIPASVRRIIDPLVQNLRVPIVGGVNRGLWWSVASSGSGYASGQRAATQMVLIEKLIQAHDVVFDIGAHHGYVTLAAARKVGATGRVYAFEPSRMNRGILMRHVAWNKLVNVSVLPFALSDFEGESRFGGSGTSKMFAMGAGTEIVTVRSAESLLSEGAVVRPDFVKIDVEGAEADTLRGLMPILSPSSRLLIAMHNADADRACTEMLEGAGFSCVASGALENNRRGQWHSDPDLYCAGPEYAQRASDLEAFRAASF